MEERTYVALSPYTPDNILPVAPEAAVPSLDFTLAPELEAHEPPEARGLRRDDVRLMVSFRATDEVVHSRFRDLPTFLEEGDLLVVNTSGTLNAALPADRADGQVLELHLSTRLPGNIWTVELRRKVGHATEPFSDLNPPESLALPAGAKATLHAPYDCGCGRPARGEHHRLWIATLQLPTSLPDYLQRYGFPIRYGYVDRDWPPEYYQTVYATEPGSAEMPSAGRAFTPEVLEAVLARGARLAPLLLHTGVASLESHEAPYEEFYRVSLDSARHINQARKEGRRIIAVGTTVVRALETVTDEEGTTHPGEGWTCEVITPARGLRSVNALLTGFHEPRSTHLAMLQALAGLSHLRTTYSAALRGRYLWHEFGDLHLLA
jgi:S-adenosylmethionine:tRNA ribosyltransferase-isomerase